MLVQVAQQPCAINGSSEQGVQFDIPACAFAIAVSAPTAAAVGCIGPDDASAGENVPKPKARARIIVNRRPNRCMSPL